MSVSQKLVFRDSIFCLCQFWVQIEFLDMHYTSLVKTGFFRYRLEDERARCDQALWYLASSSAPLEFSKANTISSI